ncbi:MAG: TonB family protein [Flavobacteriales bacterium]
MTLIHAVEDPYKNGQEKLIAYLKENSRKKMKQMMLAETLTLIIEFDVNKEGNIENVMLEDSSDKKELDALFMDLIKNMPAWNPAKTDKGVLVKQRFNFSLGMDGC